MAWCGRVLGFEHGAAGFEAQGRELLRLIGVPEDEMKNCTPEDAMAWAGMVHGFEHGAAGFEAHGRELLRLIGVPEDEMKNCTPEDARAWAGIVNGFEHGAKGRGVKKTLDEETAVKAGRFWWSPALIESFDAAVHELGGLEAAKPAAILQKLLADNFMSALTKRVVKSRLQNARGR